MKNMEIVNFHFLATILTGELADSLTMCVLEIYLFNTKITQTELP